MTADAPILVTVRRAAEILSMDPSSVYKLAADGTFTKRYIGNRNFRLVYAELVAYADALPVEAEVAS